VLAGDLEHFFEFPRFAFAALGLDFAELLQGLEEAARETRLVGGESVARVLGTSHGFGEGQGGMGFGMAGFPFVSVFGVADGKEIVLGGGEAMQTELEIGAGVGKFGFDGSTGSSEAT
jgi:hypothetical protein